MGAAARWRRRVATPDHGVRPKPATRQSVGGKPHVAGFGLNPSISPLAGGSFVLVIVLLLVLDRSDYERDCEQEHEGSFSRAAGRNIHPRCPNFLPLTEGLAPPWPFSSTFSKRMNSTYESARIRNFVGFLRTAKLVRFHLSFGRGSVSCSFL